MNEVVRYENSLNTVGLRSFTPTEMDIFWSVCAKMKRKGTQTVEFDFDVFKDLVNHDAKKKDGIYRDLIGLLNKMQGLRIFYQDENRYTQFVLFQLFDVNKKEKTVSVQASDRFEFILNSINSNFTRFELENMVALDSSYTKELYRQLMQYRDAQTRSGYWAVTVDEFRKLLSVPKSYRMSHINSRILDRAEHEFLNSKNDQPPIFSEFSIEKIKEKKGNKIHRFVFRFKEYQAIEPVPMFNWLEDEEI